MWLISIIVLILMFGVLVLLHEFGHFIVARLCGVHVYEFSVGMGPLLLKHVSKKVVFNILLELYQLVVMFN